ncbi:MAG: sensory transduction histidine kinase [Candidatus Methanoperedens nitroreducens]|uniref:Sensory transduction histidine kinase n=1 Tax=Candidatus Methanoperedens nitratireducens TaxID=1392998 RepID=A0A0P7ZF31_9EURY|nr:PAS domain S-box protein [Candidatus Methanoperedens sp. BLZ2]KAB2940738.1 MAG: PAS domain S-box protein [Candidatus Methanoperedens sp.]KPQ42118.1 MAG: sensory transduction histidine kinase [Candidatus Methanoperedens sp. BLZ1]MBZ0173809.1 PAS domain S-box protein [Candidatus Methanoperedens nitroreducens]MCX9077348.1 PAS domain S-box protein [Candidatus Methanoperedens sp.]
MQIRNDNPDELRKQYISALQDYLEEGKEKSLERAYELGRKAIADGRGILDMAAVHQDVLITVLPQAIKQGEIEETLKKAAQFFSESIAPFEMTFRGFHDSITELYNMNKILEQSEMKFRSVVQAANDAIISSKSNGNIISWNKCAETIFGYSEGEVLGKSLTILMPELLRYIHSRRLERLMSCESEYNEKMLESYGLKKDGSEFPIEISIAAWKTEEGTFYTGIVRDITERKRAQEKIRERASLLNITHDAIAVRDLEHRLTYWNKGAEGLYGWTEDEIRGKNANELLYKEESPDLMEAKKIVIERGKWAGELCQVTKDGKEIIVDSRWVLTYDRKGAPKSILIINTDITEKKKLEAQFLRAQRMDSLGTLAGGIAHDLNNILTPIMLSLQMLKEECPDENKRKMVDILERNTMRGADLIKQVLLFARGAEGERRTVQVAYLISEIGKVTKETFPKSIEVRLSIPRGLWEVTGDATQLYQVLMNLCVNARDAMPEGGILEISAENLFIDENHKRMNIEAKIGPYIVITVADTGTGIPPEILDKVFEPFFTTKAHGKGTGLGLSTSVGIIKSHSGFIDVQSEVGKGTTFKVYLPSAATTETQQVKAQELTTDTGNGEMILVVDDEASIREVTGAILETNGYRVITASDGAEALSLYKEKGTEIKIVLIDMAMPVMDGQTCIRELVKINPEIKIIAVSGLIEKESFSKVAKQVNTLLNKPYSSEELLKTIKDISG